MCIRCAGEAVSRGTGRTEVVDRQPEQMEQQGTLIVRRPHAEMTVESDASLLGWGALLLGL